MKPEQENFDVLLRALKLKRYEQPPPRYFNDFSTQVIRRIHRSTAEDRETDLESIAVYAPWLQRLFGIFQARPAFAWTFGLAACALVVSGIVYSENVETMPTVALHTPAPAFHPQDGNAPLMTLVQPDKPVTDFATSTDPVAQPVGASLFDLIQPPSIQPVSDRPLLGK